MAKRIVILASLLLGASAAAQSLNSHSGAITWSGIVDGGPSTYIIDAGADGGTSFNDGGAINVPFTSIPVLPVMLAIDGGLATSDTINLAGFSQSVNAQALVSIAAPGDAGSLCLQQGFPAPQNLFLDGGCAALTGATLIPFTLGPVSYPALQFVYTPSPNSDGGSLTGYFSLKTY